MPWWWPFPLVAAFLLGIFFTDAVRFLALRYGIVDAPRAPRKLHERPTPLLGGLAVYGAMAIPVAVTLFVSGHFTAGEMTVWHFVGLFAGGALLMVGGVLDDRFDLSPRKSFVFPLLAAAVATMMGIGVSKLTNPLGGTPFELMPIVSGALTFFWLLATTYTTKLLDGLDGLASSISGIAVFMIGALALTDRFFQPDVALLAGIVLAAIGGFLLWNFPPAHIFLGEGGSTFLGFLVGVLAVISGGKLATALMVLGIPALDVAFVIFRRLQQKKNPFTTADRSHLHHLLLDRGYSPRIIVAIYAGIALTFGLTSLLLVSWQKLVALAIVFLLSLFLCTSLVKRSATP